MEARKLIRISRKGILKLVNREIGMSAAMRDLREKMLRPISVPASMPITTV